MVISINTVFWVDFALRIARVQHIDSSHLVVLETGCRALVLSLRADHMGIYTT